jgi:hypothetical protein
MCFEFRKLGLLKSICYSSLHSVYAPLGSTCNNGIGADEILANALPTAGQGFSSHCSCPVFEIGDK